ncbi:OTU domain-containing protein 5-A-like isoform X1 [Paramormyrops kingsleyae]|uniref:ubiquitinyl hydrolase 1 n=1 Tax=Paramormyrops kingsleyae TaxID=1676925 RepID=A0A3B3SNX7_9TELE|nr:OTU domain-containing protein 5-A-like isoform X1 [Paramormyrops kingsleyae]
MTILPKKPSSSVGTSDHPDEADRRTCSDSHQRGGRAGVRTRTSPPSWSYQTVPPSNPRPQQASPQPVGAGSPTRAGDSSGSSGVAGVVGGLSGSGGPGGCCSGPGLSKRRRQAVCPTGISTVGVAGPTVGSGGPDTEEGAGNNSEDEYENASRLQSIDPTAAEQQERWFEKTLREKKGFIIKKMKEDGACLFRAVADQVYGDQDVHDLVRKHCMDYLVKNADYFSRFVTEDFTTYINRKRKSDCHGNHVEMQAMAEMYNRPVEVYQYGTEPINTFHSFHQNNDEPIRVSYHRASHYNSVVNPAKATIGVGLGLPAFKPGYADQSLMKSAIRCSEDSWIEQQMLEDKKRATDWEATNEAIEEQVARESYLQWLRDQERRSRQPQKASATCSSATAAACGGAEERSGRCLHRHSSDLSPESPSSVRPHTSAELPPQAGPGLVLSNPSSPCAPGPSNQSSEGPDRSKSPSLVTLYPTLGYQALMKEMSPTVFGLTDWEDDAILASVLAASQQEYLDSMKKGGAHSGASPDLS